MSYASTAPSAMHSNSLPFAIFDEQHGWGVVLRPAKPRRKYMPTPRWHMVQFADGMMCRTNVPGEGFDGHFSWTVIADYVREHMAQVALCPRNFKNQTLQSLLYKMWG